MKEITGKQKKKSSSLPKAIKTKQGITEKEIKIAKEFNKYLTSVGTALASKIPVVTKDLSEYLPQCNASMEHKELSFQEFEKAFKKFKQNQTIQKQPSRGILRKRCSENMQQIYRRIPVPKFDFNEVALQLC